MNEEWIWYIPIENEREVFWLILNTWLEALSTILARKDIFDNLIFLKWLNFERFQIWNYISKNANI